MKTMESISRARSGKRSEAEPRSWADVNQRLAHLGEAERQVRALRDQFEQQVAVLKQQWLESSQSLIGERTKLQGEIERYYWAHRDEVLVAGRKSMELAFGRLGSRSSHSVVVEDAAAAQQWLACNGFERYLRFRTDLDREALRSVLLGGNGLRDGEYLELLGCPGIRLRESEEFWYEVDRAVCGSATPSAEKSPKRANPSRDRKGAVPRKLEVA